MFRGGCQKRHDDQCSVSEASLCFDTAPTDWLSDSVLIDSLVNNYLFPDLSEPSDTEVIKPRIPVMNEETREELYKILYLLARQEEYFGRVIDLMNDLIPRGKCSFFSIY